ncbi:WxcM-like domain-containing protein [Acidovorax soli]|uniref:Acetyltransferase (Isoleucine patch superfamily) n=1 Tax=Acidovorax soli TaxID=592050 RepID=A0A1H3YRW9_9BURK|nr:WxcM-like domain-containing protein [Acidovorax soli]SEA14157.1 Acetyltransferase (isoleucine patch superfamily) [Acidovorax soli]
MTQPYINPLSDVKSSSIGSGTRLWQFVIVLPGAQIGRNCNICSHCLIENDVVIGDGVTVKSGVQLWDGLRVGNDVFIGPNASFTNDRFPRSQQKPEKFLVTTIHDGASIGAGAVILPGVVIGRKAMVAAGAVVTRSVPPNAVVVGNPAKIVGYVDAARSDVLDVAATKHKVGATATSVTGVNLHRMPRVADIRGSLTVGEFDRSIPFTAKRYFMVFDVPSMETRGEHAHRACHQFLICVRGSCAVVADDGTNRQEFLLDRPDIGIHLPPMVWGIQYKYSPDAVLLVFASHYYDNADYIRDYSEFLQLAGAST